MDKDGLIVKGVAGSYTVLTDVGAYVCSPRGVFRNRNTTPLVGDNAVISITSEEKKIGTLHTLKPRKNELRRPSVANIDQVIVTVATAQPAFNAGLLDRFLVLAEYEGIPAVICVNKNDLDSGEFSEGEDDFAPYVLAGYPLVRTSVVEGAGQDELRRVMSGKINVFAGPSGVGKSSLINSLSPKLDLEVGDLSAKLGRDKHTTRHTEIFALGDLSENGHCVDTPGFTSLDIAHIPKNELAGLFLEFLPYLGLCKFGNCLHNKEMGCAIKDEVGSGVHPVRYDGYLKLLGL